MIQIDIAIVYKHSIVGSIEAGLEHKIVLLFLSYGM